MSLCAECFEAGNHTGHDFNMFHSGAGGACDCGDSSVMDEKGICIHHQGRDLLIYLVGLSDSAAESSVKTFRQTVGRP